MKFTKRFQAQQGNQRGKKRGNFVKGVARSERRVFVEAQTAKKENKRERDIENRSNDADLWIFHADSRIRLRVRKRGAFLQHCLLPQPDSLQSSPNTHRDGSPLRVSMCNSPLPNISRKNEYGGDLP